MAGNERDQGTPTCPRSNDIGRPDAVVEIDPAARPSDPHATVWYEALTTDQQERRTVRYGAFPADQRRLVDRIMAEIDDDGRYRVCIAEVSRSKRVTLKRCARRARDRYDVDAVNAVYLAYAGEH